MPTSATLRAFIDRVVAGAHAEAIEEFYTPDASMRENFSPPRVGRDLLASQERATLAKVKTVNSTCIEPVFVNGDFVVIRWRFEFAWLNGKQSAIEELAYQRWDGEKIAQEQFFYDPGQTKAAAP